MKAFVSEGVVLDFTAVVNNVEALTLHPPRFSNVLDSGNEFLKRCYQCFAWFVVAKAEDPVHELRFDLRGPRAIEFLNYLCKTIVEQSNVEPWSAN